MPGRPLDPILRSEAKFKADNLRFSFLAQLPQVVLKVARRSS